MAKQTGVMKFTGRLGNLIGYERDGKFYTRTIPKDTRQSAATTKASMRFGAASHASSLIRKACADWIDIVQDSTVRS